MNELCREGEKVVLKYMDNKYFKQAVSNTDLVGLFGRQISTALATRTRTIKKTFFMLLVLPRCLPLE